VTPDQQQFHYTIRVEVDHALWPGGGVFCTRLVAPSIFPHDLFYLTDHEGRVSELRPYRFGGQDDE
jgi:hypothetical protein